MNKTLLCIFLALSLVLVACRHEQKQQPITPQEQAQKDSLALKVALLPTADCFPFYYAKERGFYDSLQLNVIFSTYQAQIDCDTAFANHRVDISHTDLIRAALLQSKGTGLYVIMQTDGEHRLITAKSKRIRNTKQLKERMIAITRHSVTDYMSDVVIDSANLGSYDIYRPQINDIALRMDMLCNNLIDGAFLPEPYATAACRKGHRSLFSSRNTRKQLSCMAISYEAMKDENRNKQTEKLIQGYNLAVEELNKKKYPQIISHTAKQLKWPIEFTDSITLPQYKIATRQEDHNLHPTLQWLKHRDLLKKGYQGDTLISIKFVRK